MIDYIKVKLLNRDLILNNTINSSDEHKVIGCYNYLTNKEEFPLKRNAGNLLVKITDKNAYLENSIHKYYNGSFNNMSHNGNDFSFQNLKTALNKLENDLQYPLEETLITNLEFGFNIDIKSSISHFLQNCVIFHNFKSPCYNPKNDNSKNIVKFIYHEYEIKLYNKSLESNLVDSNILRVEVKYKSKSQLNRFNIYSLKDLTNPLNIKMLMADYLSKLDGLFIIDNYKGNSNMSSSDKNKLIEYTNPLYWNTLKKDKHPNTVCNKKRKAISLINENGLQTNHTFLKKEVTFKYNLLTASSDINST